MLFSKSDIFLGPRLSDLRKLDCEYITIYHTKPYTRRLLKHYSEFHKISVELGMQSKAIETVGCQYPKMP